MPEVQSLFWMISRIAFGTAVSTATTVISGVRGVLEVFGSSVIPQQGRAVDQPLVPQTLTLRDYQIRGQNSGLTPVTNPVIYPPLGTTRNLDMNIRLASLIAALCLAFGAVAAFASNPEDDTQRPLIVDSTEYLSGIERTVELAMRGEYGLLRRGADRRLGSARDRIAALLKGHPTTSELKPKDRIDLVNAEEVIKAIIRNDDKDRLVCKYEAATGSRVATKECLTIAQREARAKQARRSVAESRQRVCFPGEGQSCSK